MQIGNLTTNLKYTVIGSVFRADKPAHENMRNHVESSLVLGLAGYNRTADVLGYYKEKEQVDASEELSRAIPASSLRDVKELCYLFCVRYHQDCILVINNDTEDTYLCDKDGLIFARLGKWKRIEPDANTVAWTFDGQYYYAAE